MDTQQPNQEANVTDGAAAEQPPVAPLEKKTSRRQLLINVVIGVGGLLVLLAAIYTLGWQKDEEPAGVSFIIPKGAGAAVSNDTLKSAIVLPTEFTFGPDDEAAISVTNEDSVPLRAGPFVVLPGQTYTQRFPNPGEFNIACTVDPAESITVTVLE